MDKQPPRLPDVQRYLSELSRVSIFVIDLHEPTCISTGEPALNRQVKLRTANVKFDQIRVDINFRSRQDAILRINQRKIKFLQPKKLAIRMPEEL